MSHSVSVIISFLPFRGPRVRELKKKTVKLMNEIRIIFFVFAFQGKKEIYMVQNAKAIKRRKANDVKLPEI